MATPPNEACPACAGLRARAESAEAQLTEARAQLAAIQTQRASRKRRKSPAAPSEDWLLVEELRALLNVSVGELATRLGLAYSTVLGKAQETPLSPGLREKLRALKRAQLDAMAVSPKRGSRESSQDFVLDCDVGPALPPPPPKLRGGRRPVAPRACELARVGGTGGRSASARDRCP